MYQGVALFEQKEHIEGNKIGKCICNKYVYDDQLYVEEDSKIYHYSCYNHKKADEKVSDRFLWGMDVSLKCTGVAVYNLDKRKFVYIGSFNTEKIYATKQYKGLFLNGVKLKKKVDWLKKLMNKYPPSLVSIERGYSRFNNDTQALFRAHGVVNTLLWNKPQTYYPPKSVKLAIVHGSATKEDVANSILTSATYNDLIWENEDESDAVAVAITYLIDKELIEWEKPKWSEIKELRKPKDSKQ